MSLTHRLRRGGAVPYSQTTWPCPRFPSNPAAQRMRRRPHPRKPVGSLLGAALTAGPTRMRLGCSQLTFAAGCSSVVSTGWRFRQVQDAGAAASPSRSSQLLAVALVATFTYGRPHTPGVSVRAAGLNIARGISGPLSGSPGCCDPASCQGARSCGRSGAGSQSRGAPSVRAYLWPEVTMRRTLPNLWPSPRLAS